MEGDSKIQQYVVLAKTAKGRAVVEIINKATSESGLFAFGELLDAPNVKELEGGDYAGHHALLLLFAYGTWGDYTAARANLPELNEQQVCKLKQLTVVSMATSKKVLSYDDLMAKLGLDSVRSLEDFLITHCIYAHLTTGKLNQAQRCMEVHATIGRDVPHSQVHELATSLEQWGRTIDNLLGGVEGQMNRVMGALEASKRQQEAFEARQEDMRRAAKAELDVRGAEAMMLDDYGSFDFTMDEERPATRPKTRRR